MWCELLVVRGPRAERSVGPGATGGVDIDRLAVCDCVEQFFVADGGRRVGGKLQGEEAGVSDRKMCVGPGSLLGVQREARVAPLGRANGKPRAAPHKAQKQAALLWCERADGRPKVSDVALRRRDSHAVFCAGT